MNLKIKFYNNHFTKKIDNKKGMNIYNQNGQEYLIVERDYIYDLIPKAQSLYQSLQ